MSQQELTIQVFGQLAEIIGSSSLTIPFTATTGDLKNKLLQNYPALLHSKFVIALDKKIQTNDVEITPGANLALLPPFSGG